MAVSYRLSARGRSSSCSVTEVLCCFGIVGAALAAARAGTSPAPTANLAIGLMADS
jgi:hypothetical protein